MHHISHLPHKHRHHKSFDVANLQCVPLLRNWIKNVLQNLKTPYKA